MEVYFQNIGYDVGIWHHAPHLFTPRGKLSQPIYFLACFGEMGGNQRSDLSEFRISAWALKDNATHCGNLLSFGGINIRIKFATVKYFTISDRYTLEVSESQLIRNKYFLTPCFYSIQHSPTCKVVIWPVFLGQINVVPECITANKEQLCS